MMDSGPDAATGDDDEPERSAAEKSMDLLLGSLFFFLFFLLLYPILFLFSFPNFYFSMVWIFLFCIKGFPSIL